MTSRLLGRAHLQVRRHEEKDVIIWSEVRLQPGAKALFDLLHLTVAVLMLSGRILLH